MKINNSINNYNKFNTQGTNQRRSFGSKESNPIKITEECLKDVTIGDPNKVEKPLEKFLVKASNTKIFSKVCKLVGKSKSPISMLLFLDSIILSGFYMINTATNKKIEKKQKAPLIINQGLVLAVSSIASFTLDGVLSDKIGKFKEAYKTLSIEKLADKSKKSLDKIEGVAKGIDIFKTLIVFGMIYRFGAPVILTPIANKISGKVQHSHEEKRALSTKA